VGKRSIDLVVALQWWLSKEFWPVNLREGLNEKDCMCGARSRLAVAGTDGSQFSSALPTCVLFVCCCLTPWHLACCH
jgi:hypothetical protein